MSFFVHKPKAPAQTPPTKVAGIHVTETGSGKALPIVMGQRRVSQKLIWTGDFTAIPHVHQTSTGGGGKGLGGGGGSTTTNTTYTYTSATMGALCSGPVSGIVNVYDTKGRFQQTNISETFTVPGGGGSYTVGKNTLYKNDMGVGYAKAYSQTVNDYGSAGAVTLSGNYQVPMVNNVATRIQTTGGSSTLKYFYDAGVSANGVTYTISVTIYNNGTQPVTIGGNLAEGPTIAAGTQQNVSFTVVGNGATNIQLRFEAGTAIDTLDVYADNPSISKLSDGINLIPTANQNFSGWSTFSGSAVTLTQNVPLAPGQYTTSNGTYVFHPADAGKVMTITYSYNLLNINNSELVTIPGTPFQVTVQDSVDFLSDSGVVFNSNNAALTKVAASPAAGQYSVSAGVYTFNTADSNKQVIISYVTNTQNQNSDAQTALNLTLFGGSHSQPTWSYLTSRHPEAAIGYSETAYVASTAMDLGSGGEMPNYSFEIAGPYQFGSGIVDCDPADCINALLQDSIFGIGFPSQYIGDWTNASNFWVSNNFFISPLLESQTSVSSVIGNILDAGMTAAFFSEGLLKLVPYGDTSAAGNGQIFVPNTQPIVDLTDDDFIGDGLVKVTRSAWQDANNKVQVTWSNRTNNYNSEVTTEQDDAAITRYGQRTENPQSWDFITTLPAAQFAANLRVKRSVNIRAQYTFSVTSNYSYLEPMDLVTITVPELGWTKLPVRIQRIVDHPDEHGLEITAEEFPWGTAQPTLYSKQTGVGFQPNAGQADPGNTSALIFEAPNRLGLQAGNILYGFVSGNSPDWGGCQPYVSYDGVTYQAFGSQITTPAKLGTLQTALGTGSVDPDTSNFTVQMTSNNSVLAAMSQSDFDSFVSLCVLTGQGIKYNAIPDSDGTQNTWTIAGSLVYSSTGGAVSGGKWTFTGTGAASGFQHADSTAFAVTPNTTYTLSGYIDATNVTVSGGGPFWAVYDTTLTTQYAHVLQSVGTNGRVSVTFTVPVGVTQVKVICDTFNCTVTNATTLVFSDPQLEVGSTASVYQSTSDTSFELLAYRDSTITGANEYQLATLHRGLYGTTNGPHSTGETFARLDQASFQFQYDPNFYGKTIYFKFPSFNTVGGRPQALSQAAVFSFTLPGAGAGAIDLNTGLYRPGLGSIPPSWTGTITWSSAVPGTSAVVSWNITVNRGTIPNPNQASTTLASQTYNSSQTITGLTASTNYWLYPYLDDTQTGSPLLFVTNAQVAGAVGSPAIAYTANTNNATYFAGRNDHLPLNNGPLQITTAPGSGSGTGGSGTSIGGSCPRGDMVVEHRTKGIIRIDEVREGDEILGKDGWVKVLDVVHGWTYNWTTVQTEYGEDVVVTPNHTWPTALGDIRTPHIEGHLLEMSDGGSTEVVGLEPSQERGLCVGLIVSGDQCYFIGRTKPCILTHNGNVLPRS